MKPSEFIKEFVTDDYNNLEECLEELDKRFFDRENYHRPLRKRK